MKFYLKPIFVLMAVSAMMAASNSLQAEEKMLIALKTDNFELTETDISTLAVGEAKTIETDDGKVIDILRTVDGAEVYVDGELIDLNLDGDELHSKHVIKKHLEITCEEGDECEKRIVIKAHGDDEMHFEDEHEIKILKKIEITCTDEDGETECANDFVMISDGDEFDLQELHEVHADGENHKIIVIREEVDTED